MSSIYTEALVHLETKNLEETTCALILLSEDHFSAKTEV